jgi:transcriptional regulator with XRE-family HTH domain
VPSELGKFIRERRLERGDGLREFARKIQRSAPFLTQLELDDDPPPASEDTLRAIARELEVDSDVVFALARKLPSDLAPKSATELALYRRVKAMSPEEQQRQLKKP